MPDNVSPVSNNTPASSAPATPAASAPVSSGPPTGGYTSSTDMFADLEQMMGLGDKEIMPDFTGTKQYKPGTEEDLLNLGAEDAGEQKPAEETADGEGESVDETVGTETSTQGTDDQNAFRPLKVQTEVGGKAYDFDVTSPEQFDAIVQKAIVADQVYQKYQNLMEEATALRNDKAVLDSMDERLEKDPAGFLDDLTEDLPDEVMKEWILRKAEELGQDPQQRSIQRKLRQADLLQEKLDRIQAEKEQLAQARLQAARESDAHTIKAWIDGQKTRLSTKIPEKYNSLVEDQIKSVIMEARDKTRRKETVTIQTLDTMLMQKIKPILDLISTSRPQTNVNTEVGKAIQDKKKQGLTRIQNAASARVPSGTNTKTRMQTLIERQDNPIGIFDEILRGMDDGRIRIRGE